MILISQPPKRCHQIRVDVRKPGKDMKIHNCKVERRKTCKNADELEEFSFKPGDCGAKCYQETLKSKTVNSTILMCKDGICKDFSQEYSCHDVQTHLNNLIDGNQCSCQSFEETYLPTVEYLHLPDSKCPQRDEKYFLSCQQVFLLRNSFQFH